MKTTESAIFENYFNNLQYNKGSKFWANILTRYLLRVDNGYLCAKHGVRH